MAQPRTIGRFEVVELLGTGGFATVWLATDPVLDAKVAIKVLADNWSQDLDVRRRFIDEAKLLWQADDDRLVRVHQVDELDDGRPYVVMGLADRGTLRDRIDERATPFETAEAAAIAAVVAEGVQVVHDLGAVHRDIKPSNILIRSVAGHQRHQPVPGLAPDEQLLIADLGLSKSLDSSAFTMVAGSPEYAAPEQAAGLPVDRRSDVYSIGVVLHELLTGEPPATLRSMDEARVAERAVPQVGGELQAVLDRTLAPDPGDRFQRAAEIAAALRGSAPLPDPAPTPPAPSTAAGGRRRWPLIAAVGAVVAAAVIAVIVLTNGGGSDPEDDEVAPTPTVGAEEEATADPNPTEPAQEPTARPTEVPTPLSLTDEAFPVPPATILRSSEPTETGDLAAEFLLDAPVDEALAYYDELEDPIWSVTNSEVTDDGTVLSLTSAEAMATLTVQEGASTATSGITQMFLVIVRGG